MTEEQKAAFEKIYTEHFSYVYNFIYMKVLHKEVAEDICSKAFFNAFSHFESYDPAISGVRTWLCTIARNCLLDYYKSTSTNRLELTDDMPDVPVSDDYEIMKNPLNQEVGRLLSLLSSEEREILSLRFGMDLPVKEIAEMLGITQNACSHRLNRIIEKCRKIEEKAGNSLSDFLP